MRPARPAEPLSALEARIGHTFHDQSLITRALTHMSHAPAEKARSYQRLEFLGDRVLGLVVSAMLFQNFPQAGEGELSRRLAVLVRKETCADVALDWQVSGHIRLGETEAQGHQVKPAILGDVCEALIGAISLDGGLDSATVLAIAEELACEGAQVFIGSRNAANVAAAVARLRRSGVADGGVVDSAEPAQIDAAVAAATAAHTVRCDVASWRLVAQTEANCLPVRAVSARVSGIR